MTLPKISVITASFNQGKYITDTIESVLKQNYENFEHIVIDGCSTDETVSVLKKYSHLNWVSEKDNGQSDALNKGFEKASGDILCWLNSDDWLAENVFHDVAKALEEHPIVLGGCELRDQNGKTLEVVPNKERTWFDILKYWVPYSIPAQPSIFFRREVLDLVRRNDGLILDNELFYCMDYDLWMRLCLHFPMIKRIDRVLSYYRMTEENKTGQKTEGGMPYAEPEMSRIFRRYKDVAFTIERMCSLVSLVEKRAEVGAFIKGYLDQYFPDSEMIFVLSEKLKESAKDVKREINAANEELRRSGKDRTIRFIQSASDSLALMANDGANVAAGSILLFTADSKVLSPNLISEITQQFQTNKIGATALVTNPALWQEKLPTVTNETFAEFVNSTCSSLFLAVRKIAYAEIDGCDDSLPRESEFIDVIKRTIETGWSLGALTL